MAKAKQAEQAHPAAPVADERGFCPDPRNANKGTERGRNLLRRSMESYGAGRSILADKNGVLIAGNKTYETANELGLPVRVIETAGDELVIVKRVDLDLEKDRAARELAYADNRVAELDLSWDLDQIKEDLGVGIGLDGFWIEAELENMLGVAINGAIEAVPVATGDPGQAARFGIDSGDAGDGADPRVAGVGVQQIILTFKVEDARVFLSKCKDLLRTRGVPTISDLMRVLVDEVHQPDA
jgi:hypothetical protein